MAEPGFDEGRKFLTKPGTAALSVFGVALVDLRRADAKEKRKRAPEGAPRPDRAPDDLERVVQEVKELTHAYVDTMEQYPTRARRVTPEVAPKAATLTQLHLRALSLLSRGEEQGTPALDAHNLHYAVRDALVGKRHNPLIANAIDNMWSAILVIAVEQPYPGEENSGAIVPRGSDA